MLKRIFYLSAALVLFAFTARAVSTGWQGPHPKIAAMAYGTDGLHQRIYVIDTDGNVYVRALWNAGTFSTPADQAGGPTPIASPVGNFWELATPLHD